MAELTLPELAMIEHIWNLIHEYSDAQRSRILGYVQSLSMEHDGRMRREAFYQQLRKECICPMHGSFDEPHGLPDV